MTKERSLASAARYGTVDEVRERLAVDGVDDVSDTGLPPIVAAISNADGASRRAIIDELLAAGADASATTAPEGGNVLHVLLASRGLDTAEKAELVPRLIDAGADINLRDGDGWRPLALMVKLRVPDTELAPLYDVVLDLDGLELTEPANPWDESVLDHARKLRQRADLVGRIETYLSARGVDVPPRQDRKEG